MQGRDNRFRPIIILNAYKIDIKVLTLETILKGLTFFLELVVNHMLLPGQVESWVIIMDLNFQGISDLPFSVINFILCPINRL
jgi:hypothetical protein